MSKRSSGFGKRLERSAKTSAEAGIEDGLKWVVYGLAFGAVVLVWNTLKNGLRG